MRIHVRLFALAAFGATVSVVVSTGALSAAPPSCAGGFICVYDGTSYGAPQYSAAAAAFSLGSMNDKASSLGNSRSVNRARYYRDANYLGWDVCVSANDANPSLASDRNNRISSMAIQTSQFC
ncbi:MAG: peptidase inhibitor family I36 protein [Actinomycetota bacterium]|nr:MAG: peptidase inhibitor family I36 protein [Actinomycetota bacterium]